MSWPSTPTQLSRVLVVPGIDTKPPLDKVNTTLSYGGLHTPPHSAHESRRPSLQYGGLSEAPYSASSYTHSQPVTPIQGLNHGSDFFPQRWSQSIDAQDSLSTSLPGAYITSPVAGHSFHTAFGSGATYHNPVANDAQVYSHIDHANSVDNLSLQPSSCSPTADTWGQSEAFSNTYAPNNVGLGSTLFPTPHGMNVPANSPSSVFDHIGPSLHINFQYQSDPSAADVTQGSYGEPSHFQQPRIVVPSQVSPQDDYTAQQLSIYTTPHHSHDVLQSSFSSGRIPFGDYEMVEPPSPQDVYFAHSEDEDYLMVKAEGLPSPVLGPSSRRQADFPVRPRRRTSRRTRKPGNRTTWCRHDFNGCEISCQGTQCCIEGPRRIIFNKPDKPYKCKFVMEDGTPCVSGFDRSEDLKRHEGSHSGKEGRKYFCPLKDCERKIGRPDNAGDHFKTHLRPKTTGKRNAHFDWPVVQDAIWDAYDDKKVAKKLLDGLRRWISAGMLDTSGGKRSGRAR